MNHDIMTLAVPAAIAGVLGLLLPFAVRPLLHRWNLVDLPTARSSHTTPVFRGMGLAIACAVAIAFFISLVLGLVTVDRSIAIIVLAGAIASGMLGWGEDFRGVPIIARLAVQFLVGAAVTIGLTLVLGTSIWWIPLGVIAVIAYINVTNFMDGVNGISGLHGFMVGGVYAYAGYSTDTRWLMVGGAALAVGYLAFLPWNIRTGKNVFLGDAGSYFLGGAIACMAVGAFLSGIYVEYILSPLLIYLADTGTTLLRRVLRGEQWYKPHRSHTYQRLTDYGFSHVASALLVNGLSLVVSVITIVALPFETQQALGAGLVVLILIGFYLVLPYLLKRRAEKHA
ncbi:glycosyltransferase family 4 protein [Rothia sp. ZJ932]|uniref:MraY family glycosyltransferase n=1 Tax=Rothia sp. ZJ932 TaxID=2810516 RepID=UPI001F0887F1|nr:glycosyltransferase family 4 protein [Rothia sp. ZJ932]